MKEPLVSRVLAKVAKRAGVKINLEPEWGVVGQIILPGGQKRYFRNAAVDLNLLGAAKVASDKGYASYFMQRMGYAVVPGKAFYSDALCKALKSKQNSLAAWRYAKKIGLPVIVKPNSRAQGVGVSKIYTRKEFERAVKFIFTKDNVMLVQQALTGQDYRVVVLDKEVISAYERIPLTVIGDGRKTVVQLLAALQRKFKKSGRDTVINPKDFRIRAKLARENLRPTSIPAKGRKLVLLDNANLSAGGMAVDVTETMHPGFKNLAVRLTKDMGLRYCGVDLMVSGDITAPPRKYWILEINDTPGLDHYVSLGKKQARIVNNLYLKVLRAMKKS